MAENNESRYSQVPLDIETALTPSQVEKSSSMSSASLHERGVVSSTLNLLQVEAGRAQSREDSLSAPNKAKLEKLRADLDRLDSTGQPLWPIHKEIDALLGIREEKIPVSATEKEKPKRKRRKRRSPGTFHPYDGSGLNAEINRNGWIRANSKR